MAHWSRFLLLSAPVDDSNQPSVAQIHLGTRQIALNYDCLAEKDLFDCVEGVLAHEIGHVLGLAHRNNTTNLMNNGTAAITSNPPILTNADQNTVRASAFLV